MRVYFFYDRKTGNVVHEHRAEGRTRPNAELLKLVHPSNKKASLEVLEVDESEVEAGRAYRVDPKKRILQADDKKRPRGHASVQHSSVARQS